MRTPTSQRGAAVVEFALLALLLLVFVFGIIEFGLIWLQSHYIANAVREGSRVASKIADVNEDGPSLENGPIVEAAVEKAVKTYLEGAFIYSAIDFDDEKNCCADGDFVYVHPPSVEVIDGTENFALRVTITVKTKDIWDPVLWPLLNLIPNSNVGTIEAVTDEAAFPIIN